MGEGRAHTHFLVFAENVHALLHENELNEHLLIQLVKYMLPLVKKFENGLHHTLEVKNDTEQHTYQQHRQESRSRHVRKAARAAPRVQIHSLVKS